MTDVRHCRFLGEEVVGRLFFFVLGGAFEEQGARLEDAIGGVLALDYRLSAVTEHVGADTFIDYRQASPFIGDFEAKDELLRIPVDRLADHEAGDPDHPVRRPLSQQFLHGQVMGAGFLDVAQDQPYQDQQDDGSTHEILHPDKNNRPKDKKVRETEAEAVAFVVCHAIGLDTNGASSDYIQLYNGNKETLIESLGRIQKTASGILEAIMDKESQGETVGGKSCTAVAA